MLKTVKRHTEKCAGNTEEAAMDLNDLEKANKCTRLRSGGLWARAGGLRASAGPLRPPPRVRPDCDRISRRPR